MIELTVGRSLRLAAERSPDGVAVACAGETRTHPELNRAGNRIANALHEIGLRKGDRLAVMMTNSVRYLEVIYAAAKSGLALVFVNYRFTGQELARQVNSSGAKLLVYSDDVVAAVREARALVPGLLTIAAGVPEPEDLGALSELTGAASDAEPGVDVSENDVFYLGYTSGTTGFPKGAIVTHRNRSIAYRYWAIEYGFGPRDHYLQSGPFHHSVQVGFTLAQLSLAGRVTVLPRFDAHEAMRAIREGSVNWSFMVPYMYNAILALPVSERRAEDVASLRFLISAASPLPTSVKERLIEAFPQAGLHEFYGATEAGVVTNLRPEDQRRKVRCVGRPILDMEVQIVDERLHPVQQGEVGLLYMKGPTLFGGYYEAPEQTALAFRDGWCTLGDLARQDEEGYLYIVDRAKDVIKSGGVNIFPAEIEEALAHHSQVFEAAVIGIPDAKWGEAVHAVVVPKNGQPTTEELLDFCRARLSGYKLPKSIEFRSDLPRNPGGKVLKRVLRDEFWQGHEVRV